MSITEELKQAEDQLLRLQNQREQIVAAMHRQEGIVIYLRGKAQQEAEINEQPPEED